MWRRARPDPAVEAAWAGFLGFAKALDEGSRALLAPSLARRPGRRWRPAWPGSWPAWRRPGPSTQRDHRPWPGQAATAAALDAAEGRPGSAAAPAGVRARNERVAEVLDELLPVQAAEQELRPCAAAAIARAGGRQTRQGGSRRRPPRPPR